MAVATDLTADNLVNEAFKKVGLKSATTTQKTRAKDYFLQEIFNDIWTRAERRGNTRFRTLQAFEVQITTIGQSRYDFASDFDEEIIISILDGTHRDTAQSGGSTTITFASDEDATEDNVVGKYILITGGTGANGLRQATAYNTTTKQATVDSAWDTNPDATSTYLIASQVTELNPDNIKTLGGLGCSTATGKPSSYARIVEVVNDRFILDKPPDLATYGLLIRYYTNIHKVDLTEGSSTLITRIYNNWKNVLTTGVAMKIAEDENDTKEGTMSKNYDFYVEGLLDKEVPYNEEFSGFEVER